ncbi:MAG: diphthine--ammonia ligase [Candidatus Iainarchaeum archaeon]|uniref:Diphthine--ammonia ligase n=1 Tax=Candidatus Iainarchaeum sp. TaxID=3101447 RepID=A0A7T9I279_9ARCH|nr:MAG: diphthine--ammonia ligase [Candidatus Diapherotrites archaeon]
MRLCVLFSGGKDSTYAVHLAKQAGHEVACLLSMAPHNKESFLFHVPNMHMTELQAKSMEIPLVLVQTSGKKTQEYMDLKQALQTIKKTQRIQGIVTGAVNSIYQATRMQTIAHELGLYCFNPLWQTKPSAHWHELLLQGFEIMLVSVAAHGLDKKWLGKTITSENVDALIALERSHGISPIGEGGEYESYVVDAPLYWKKIRVQQFKDEWKGLQGTRHIMRAQLVAKPKSVSTDIIPARKRPTMKARRKKR